MQSNRSLVVRATLCVFAAAILLLPARLIWAAPVGSTLDNLQTAYNGESNANARYEAFAKKADQEGYAGVAVLFRAAAKAESVHAGELAAQIKNAGATPKADVKAPEVKSTKENVDAALKGETYEKDTMYPDFIKQAKAEKNAGALEVFTEAKTAEAGHAQFYAQALNNLEAWKVARPFFVCTVCGYTVEKITFEKCPSCLNPKTKYVEVK